MPLADRDRRQIDAVGHIAHRPDAVDIGFREFVDDDGALFVQLHAGVFQAESFGIGFTADREENLIDLQFIAIAEFDPLTLAFSLNALDRPSRDDLQAASLHLLGDMRAHILVEAAQDLFAAIDQRGVHAEP